MVPFIDRVAGRVNLRVSQLDVKVETKTEDNVFVHVVVAVQYRVLPEKVYDAFYKLAEARGQITSFVFDVVRARVPRSSSTRCSKKDEIADVVKNELSPMMDGFGYGIVKALVTDIDPDEGQGGDERDQRGAARARGGDREGRSGADPQGQGGRGGGPEQGAAGQGHRRPAARDRRRLAGVGGRVRQSVPGATAHDVMNLVLMTQYFDTLKEIGASNHSNTILIPHSPGFLSDLAGQIRTAIISGEAVMNAAGKANGGAGDLRNG